MTKKTCLRETQIPVGSLIMRPGEQDHAECPQCHQVVRANVKHDATMRLKEPGFVVLLAEHTWEPRA